MPAPNLGQLVATTIDYRAPKIADAVEEHNPLLSELNKKGNKQPFRGGDKILQPIMYAENGTVGWYTGAEQIDISPQDVIDVASFEIKQCAGSVTMTGLEEIKNRGKEAIIDLVETKVKVLEKSLMNLVDEGLYSTGTAAGGKQIGGLQYLVADAPTSGTVGGIDRGTWTFWRNFYWRGVTDGGAAVSAANIKKYLNHVINKVSRNSEKPNFIILDNNYFEFLQEALQAIQVVSSSDRADAGYKTLTYQGIPVVNGGGMNGHCPANHAYVLNLDYLHWRPAEGRNFTPIGGDRLPIDQDMFVRIVAWAGNLTMSNALFQGVLVA